MTSKQKTTYGYWSDNQASQNGYAVYNSTRGPVEITEVSYDPPEIYFKLRDKRCDKREYVGVVTNLISSHNVNDDDYLDGFLD